MIDTPTTPESVAARLTDDEIETNARGVLNMAWFSNYEKEGCSPEKIVAVLSDYVRLRRLNGKLKECLNQAYGDKMNTYRMTGNEVQNWGIVLAEAEKGEAK